MTPAHFATKKKITNSHMSFNCMKLTTFRDSFVRDSFVKWWCQNVHQNVNLKEYIILYDWYQKVPYNSLLFTSTFLAKYHVFVTNPCSGFLDFDSFSLRLKNDARFLKEIVVQNKYIDKFGSTRARLL